jgi:formiminotetrahydrofolate cyclodeaminase
MERQDLTRWSIDEFLDRTANRSPTPGGGSVTALVAAAACALGRMVVAYSIPAGGDGPTHSAVGALGQRLQTSDQLLRALVTKDAEAYAKLRAASKQARPAEYEQALLQAVALPMEVAAIAAQTLEALNQNQAQLNRRLRSDLGIAATLLDAAAQAAKFTVVTNLPLLDDKARAGKLLADIEAILDRCRGECESIRQSAAGS